MIFNKKDMINFAQFVHGPEIDILPQDDTAKFRELSKALDYWIGKKRIIKKRECTCVSYEVGSGNPTPEPCDSCKKELDSLSE